MEKIQIQAEVHRRIIELRRIERLLDGPTFNNQIDTQQYIDNFDSEGLERYLFSSFADDLEELSIRQLRSKAKAYHVPYYSIMNRLELIKVIHEYRRRNEEGNTSGRSTGDEIRQSNSHVNGETPTSSKSVS